MTRQVARRLARLLQRRGLGEAAEREEADPLAREEPLLATLYAASVQGRIATGPRSGTRVARFGDRIEVEDVATPRGPRCAEHAGSSVPRSTDRSGGSGARTGRHGSDLRPV